jgi:hypothetical protein
MIKKWSEFINEAVSVSTVLTDLVKFLEESPVITVYPEDEEGETREGWLSREHKLYSVPAIKKWFKEKYGTEYSSLSIDNVIGYEPNIKALEKMLSDKGLKLQWTKLKGQYGDLNWFFSVNLEDSELKSIKDMYENEFKKRYDKYFVRKSQKFVPSKKKKERKNEALEVLLESLFNL